jgi:hypothetical protein
MIRIARTRCSCAPKGTGEWAQSGWNGRCARIFSFGQDGGGLPLSQFSCQLDTIGLPANTINDAPFGRNSIVKIELNHTIVPAHDKELQGAGAWAEGAR